MTRSDLAAARALARAPFDFAGRTVVITGGAGGLGRALAADAIARGARVALLDRDGEALTRAADQLSDRFSGRFSGRPGSAASEGGPASTHVVDLTDVDALPAIVEQVRAAHPSVDVLINNAGISMAGAFTEGTLAQFDAVMAVNVRGLVAMTYAVLPHLTPGGHIVNIASLAGATGMPYSSAYSASKFAVRGLSETLALELPARGIGVSVIVLGATATGIEEHLVFSADATAEQREQLYRAAKTSSRLTSAPAAARRILDAVHHRTVRRVVGPDARVIDAVARHAPGIARRVLSRAIRPQP